MYIFHCKISGGVLPIKCESYKESPEFEGMLELHGVIAVNDTSYPDDKVVGMCIKKSWVEYYLILGDSEEEIKEEVAEEIRVRPVPLPEDVPHTPQEKELKPRKKRSRRKR